MCSIAGVGTYSKEWIISKITALTINHNRYFSCWAAQFMTIKSNCNFNDCDISLDHWFLTSGLGPSFQWAMSLSPTQKKKTTKKSYHHQLEKYGNIVIRLFSSLAQLFRLILCFFNNLWAKCSIFIYILNYYYFFFLGRSLSSWGDGGSWHYSSWELLIQIITNLL